MFTAQKSENGADFLTTLRVANHLPVEEEGENSRCFQGKWSLNQPLACTYIFMARSGQDKSTAAPKCLCIILINALFPSMSLSVPLFVFLCLVVSHSVLAHLSVCLCFSLSVYLSACLIVFLLASLPAVSVSLCLSICLPV